MRRFSPLVLSLGSLLAILLALGAVATTSAAPETPSLQPVYPLELNSSPCYLEVTQSVQPPVVLLGETTNVIQSFTPVCAGESEPLHVVMAIDVSADMEVSRSLGTLSGTALEVARGLNLDENSATEAAVTEFDTRSRTLVDLTNDEGRLLGAIAKTKVLLTARALESGIDGALSVLRNGRGSSSDSTGPAEAILLYSDGHNERGCAPAIAAANRAKSEGVEVFTVCDSAYCAEQCLRQVASSPRLHFKAGQAPRIVDQLDVIRRPPQELETVTVHDVLHDWVRLVEGSFDPVPSAVAPGGETIDWEISDVSGSGFTVSYELEPLQAGNWRANWLLEGHYIDGKGRGGSFRLPGPHVLVLRPR